MATTQTATANPYAQDAQKAKFRQTVSELYKKRKDPKYVKFALEQVGYDGNLVDQELSRMQAIESGQPVQQKQTFSGVPGENLDQNLLAEGQRTALLYGQRMFQSGKILDKLDDSIGSKGLLGSIKQKGDEMAAGGTITGQFVSDEFKQFDQAKRDFINASLRRESGAVISPEEFENAKKQYFPVPGDSPEVLAQKKANRELQARGFLKSAGVADSEINFSGDGQLVQPQTAQSSQVEQAKQWLQANPNDPRAEKVKAKLLSLEGGVSASPSTEQVQQRGGSFDLGKAADKVANFLGIKKFGEGIGATIFLNTTEGKELQKKAAEGDKVALEALQAVLDEAPSAKEVIGSAALTALNIATAGTATEGLGSFKLASGAVAKEAAIGATTTAGKLATGAATGYAYDVTGDLEKNKSIGDVVTPGLGTALGFTGSAISVLTNALGKGGQKAAERLYNSSVKPTVEDTKKAILYQGKTLGREALDRGLVGGKEKLFHQSSSAIVENEKKLQNILKNSKETISREEILPYLAKLKDKLKSTPTPSAQKSLQSVDEALNALPENFTLQQANVFKRNIYDQVGDLAYKLDPNLKGEAQNSKAIASALKDLIEKKASSPEVGAINKELAFQGKIKDATLNGLAKTMGNNIAGVGTIGALIEKTIGSTPFKTYSAKVIDRASRKLEKAGTGNVSKLTKVMVMNALREAQDEEKN